MVTLTVPEGVKALAADTFDARRESKMQEVRRCEDNFRVSVRVG